jgi:WD40 repeat protein
MEFLETAAACPLSVKSVDFSPDGDRLAAVGDDPTLTIATMGATGADSDDKFQDIGSNNRGMAWDPAGTYAAIVQTSGHLIVFDMSSKEQIWKERLAPAVRLPPGSILTAFSV